MECYNVCLRSQQFSYRDNRHTDVNSITIIHTATIHVNIPFVLQFRSNRVERILTVIPNQMTKGLN